MILTEGQRILDRYLVGKLLGEGAMGQVFRGTHEHLDMAVAIKVLGHVQSEELAARFTREARLMAKVRHPNVVSILDFGHLPWGHPCIIMELLQGVPLNEVLSGRGPLPWPEAMGIVTGILAGLDALHREKILHRDLKPSNIVVSPGPPMTPKLIDFGIARDFEGQGARLTKTGAIVGSPAYMAPEQVLAAPLDTRTDLYAAGIVFYEVMTGEIPFGGDGMAAMLRRLRDPVPIPRAPSGLPPIPEPLAKALVSVLVPEPEKRPSTAAAYAAVIRKGLTDARMAGPIPHRTPAPPPAARPTGATSPGTDRDIGTMETLISTAGTHPEATPHLSPSQALDPLSSAQPDTWNTNWSRIAPGAPSPGDRRYLIAAMLPPSRIEAREDRRWLAGLTHGHGRSFSLGNQFWFALQGVAENHPVVMERAEDIVKKLQGRYGDLVRTEVVLVDETFILTGASLVGAAPLPETLERLMTTLSQRS